MAAKFPVSFEIINDEYVNKNKAPSEVAELVLGPFSRIPKLEFTNVVIGGEALLTVNLRNPTDSVQCVDVVYPKDFIERGFSLNAAEFEIPPYSKQELEIRFRPIKELQCRDTIYIKDKFRCQKSQFQLTSRAIPANKKTQRKRKTWNVNKRPVVVPTQEGSERIQSLPPESDVVVTAPASNIPLVANSPGSNLNVTFPVVSVAATPISKNIDHCVKRELMSELSTVLSDDSLEEQHVRTETIKERRNFARREIDLSTTDVFTFDSVQFTSREDKENCVSSAKKRRVFDMSFSDLGFDDLTPDRNESRSILRSIDNISYNSLTPRVSVTKVAYSETISYSTTVTTIKHEPVSLQSCNKNGDEPFQSDKNIGTSNQIKLEPTSPNVDLFRNPTSPNLRHNPPTNSKQVVVKPEPVTPITNRSPNVNLFRNPTSPNSLLNPPTNSKQAIIKPEPVTPISNQIDSNNAFKVPLSGAIKPELFTPIPRSESMEKLPLGFTISPPKGILHSRRDLFGKGAMSSTPREKKPVLQKPRPSSRGEKFDTLKVQVSFWNASTSSETGEQGYTSSASSKKSIRGSTLSPKSLTAFKKNVRVHLPPKKLSRPSSAKSVDSTSSESIIVADLYTNDFKEPVYNLDIYGATTMSDPFARCAIHPLEFREKQGQQLIKWVNSVLTPPEEYSAYEAGVDVASLWKKSVTSDNVPLPPSRETVSSKFHKNEMHLLNLRKSAHLIFKSTSVSQTLYKIYSKIDVGYISVKDDMDLHSDQGARYHLVQMMMYYNPLWLRIGLEAIYGRDIPLQPRHTVIGLMHFIKHNLLSDKYISERNSYQNIHHLKTPKFKKEMNDFIVFKFLSLVFFLDIAKQKAIVPYDPCLFNKNSPIKESEGMINEFIKEFIKCVGHMKRNLASMGFVVSHKQTAIDEYNFAVQSHLDLRDGASLTRLMEIILQKKHLINKLRLPAISRLQKIHNVKLAFNALMEEGVTIVDVQSSDVVDGHREKIMSLLWQILHKFLKPRIEKGALVIQRWWKKKLLKIEITRRVQYKKELKLHESAVKIQALWRGYYLRKNFTEIRKDLEKQKIYHKLLKEEKAAVTIQRWYRQTKHLIDCRKQYLSYLQEASARKIQIWYRNRLETRRTKLEFLKKKQACIKIQQWHRNNLEAKKQRCKYMREKSSAITIQRWCRATYAMKKQKLMYDKTRKAVITIQQSYRALVAGRKLRADYVRMKKSTIVIQRWYRATSAAKKQKMEDEAKSKAAVTIQQHFRALVLGRKQRHAYELKRKSAVAIQRWYRATVAMRNQKLEYETTRKAIITIQQHYRALAQRKKQRAEYILIRKSAIVIQRWYRATSTMQKQKLEYETKHKAIVTIQRYYRAMIQGKMQRNKYLLMKESAIIIQRRYRAMLAMKKQKLEYETVHKAVITIQRYYRAMIQGKMQRNKYLLMKESAIIIQRRYRAMLAMKKQKLEYETVHKAVITIQRYYRAMIQGKMQRNEYLLIKKSAIIIQRRYRAMLAVKKQKLEYETKHKAIVTIQRYYRATIQGKIQRNKYLLMKESAIIIQRRYRAMLAMKKQKLEYETRHKAIVTIQRYYRATIQGKIQRNEYLLMKESAIIIQRRYRAMLAMKKQKLEYETVYKAVITIQRYYRAMIQGKMQRNKYLLMKESAIIIQRRYRAMLAMKKQKLEYETVHKAVITIQQYYRAMIQGKMQRNKYLLMKESAIIIQCRYRAMLAMKKQKLEYETVHKAVITIQRYYRATIQGKIQRNKYLLMKESAIIIQRRYRAMLAMKKQKLEYETKLKAIVTIQRYYRAMIQGKIQRNEYLLMKESAIIIQRRYRAMLAMKKQKLEYETKHKAIVTIQRYYRATIQGKMQRNEYLLMKESAIIIQRRYRAMLAMKKQKLEYETVHKAVITIQRYYRATIQGKIQRNKYLLMKESAIIIQRRYRAMLAMKKQKLEYETVHKAVITIQQHYRALAQRKKQRAEYILTRNSAVVIQRWYRATSTMRKQKLEYETKHKAVVTIQRYYRAVIQGKKQRNEYLLMKESAIIIQRRYRAMLAMKKQKLEYETVHKAVITIQQHYRALAKRKKQRAEYILIRKSAVVIQRWYRAILCIKKQKLEMEIKRKAALKIWFWYWRCKAARITRNNFLLLREKVLFVQRRFRENQEIKRVYMSHVNRKSRGSTVHRSLSIDRMQEVKEAFVSRITAAVKIQKWYRDIRYRRQQERMAKLIPAAEKILNWYRLVVIMRKDRKVFLYQKQAAIRIQRCYRSYRQRVAQANKPATDVKEAPRTLLQIYDHAIEVLMSHNLKTMSLHRVYVSFKNLDFVTMYSSVLCEKLAEPSMTRVYALIFHILDIGSRSDAYQSVFGHGLNVLLHLTLFSKTYDAVWKNTLQYDGINVLLRLMGKFLEKKEELFCRAATLIWLLSYSPNQLEIIRKQSELLTRLSYYSKKVAQGKKVSLKKYKPVLPKLKSTWGYTVENKEFPSRTDAVVALHHRFEMTL